MEAFVVIECTFGHRVFARLDDTFAKPLSQPPPPLND